MNDDAELELERVAQAVGDGRPVDWRSETTTLPDLGTLLEELRFIEGIAAAHGVARGDGPAAPSIAPEAPASREAQEAGTTWGPLRILGRIGAGGFADVFRAFDEALGREVALKLLRPRPREHDTGVERFLREARHLALVRHPNVVMVFGAANHSERVGLWTELINGRTLEQLLGDLGRFSAREATLIGIDVCRALGAVHERNLVHCDVKASNVMREEGGRIVVMDFGAATRLPGFTTSAGAERHRTGTLMATAPELLHGERPGVTSDVYSLGTLLYRLVTNRYPVEGSSFAELLEGQARGRRTPLREIRPELPEDFVEAVERSIHADPHQRFESAHAMEQALVPGLAAGTTGR